MDDTFRRGPLLLLASTLAYIANDGDKSSTPFTENGALAKDKVWTSLPFVKKGNVHRLPDGIWMFGGPESMNQYVDSLVAALTK